MAAKNPGLRLLRAEGHAAARLASWWAGDPPFHQCAMSVCGWAVPERRVRRLEDHIIESLS
ncbi:MAG: hypothetical protein U1F70_05545 [Candidatus Competibacteraceae bacterium]